MPTVLKIGPYRFYFYSHESNEPPHIHVDRDASSAKFWIEEAKLAQNHGFSRDEVGKLQDLVLKHQSKLLGKWYEYFGKKNR